MLKKLKSMKKKYWIILFLCIITGISWLLISNLSKEKTSKEAPLQSSLVKNLSQESMESSNFLLTGKVKPKNKRSIMLNKESGKVMETLVKKGDKVTAGQELFRYVNPQNEFEIKQAQLAVENQQKVVEQANEASARKWASYNKKNNELNQSKHENSPEDGDKTSLEEMVNQALEEANLADVEIRNAKLALEKTELELEAADQMYGQNGVISEIDGTVTAIDEAQLNNGKSTEDNKAFMEIVDKSSLYVEGDIDEFNKNQLKLEQAVDVVDRSDDKKKWQGKVSQIGEESSDKEKSEESGEENPNLSKYPFKVLLDNQNEMPALDSNMFISVQPLKNKADIFLPLDYLVKGNKGYFVWGVADGKLKKMPVEVTENKDLGHAKINTGLTLEDEVVYPNNSLKEGMSIKANVKVK